MVIDGHSEIPELLLRLKRQRIFNKISKTIVIKLRAREEQTENITYRKD
jgi:hypothetical protein